MKKPEEIELFDYLSRVPRFRDWLDAKLAEDLKILVQVNDVEQLRKAQGRAGLLQSMLRLLDESPALTRR